MLNKILRLERPLAILDLETTGLNPEICRIWQIAVTIHYPHRDPIAWKQNVNPEVPNFVAMVGEARVTAADLINEPTFKQIAPALAPKLLACDIGGHNANDFDLKVLMAEMRRAGVEFPWDNYPICTLRICRIKDGHTLENAYRRYVNPEGFKGAHDAGNDVAASEELLVAQLNKHQDIPRTIKELSEFCFSKPGAIDKTGKFLWIDNIPCINFGKNRGRPMKDVEKPYYIWMINTNGFPDDAILIAANALKGIYPTKS